MNRNIRGRYLQTLGVKQPDFDSILKAENIDVLELKSMVVKTPFNKKHRSIIWQLFLGVITRSTKTWPLQHASHDAFHQQLSKLPLVQQYKEDTSKQILQMFKIQHHSDPFTVFQQLCSIMLSPLRILKMTRSIEEGEQQYRKLFNNTQKLPSITQLNSSQLAFFSVYCKLTTLSTDKQQIQLIKVIASNVDEPSHVSACFSRITKRLMRRVLPPELHHWPLLVSILVEDWLPSYAKEFKQPLEPLQKYRFFFVDCFASLFTNLYLTRFLDIIFCHGVSMVVLLGLALAEDILTRQGSFDQPVPLSSEERVIKRALAMYFRIRQLSNVRKNKNLNVDTSLRPIQPAPVFYSP